MVGKAKSIAHTSNAIDYGKNKLNAQEISRHNVIGRTGFEIEQEFKVYQNLNERTKLNTISVVLSPEPKDGRKLTDKDFEQITKDYLKKMNLEKNQHIAFVHRDRDHTHIHLYVNRINAQGKAFNDSYIGKRTQQKADEIAQERGLIRAREVQKERLNIGKEIKNEIFQKHQEVLKSNPNSFSEYSKKMANTGIKIEPTINKQGQLQGFRVLYQGENFKASEVHRSMSIGNLIKQGLTNDLKHELKPNKRLLKSKSITSDKTLQTAKYQLKGFIKTNARPNLNFAKSIIQPKLSKSQIIESIKFDKFYEELAKPDMIVKLHEELNKESKIENNNKKDLDR